MWQSGLFVWKAALGVQCPIPLHLVVENVQQCPQQDQNKTFCVQSFCFTIKLSPFWSPHHLLQAPEGARPAWRRSAGQERMQEQTGQVRVTKIKSEGCVWGEERESVSLIPWDCICLTL